MEYNFRDIEKKWQARWAKEKTFAAKNDTSKPKYYSLDMFPYPSGAGLHVGHPLGYIASDIVSRFKRLNGFNVLHPMGYDSFGLPAEQYAIQTGQHPAITTKNNIARYREQMDKIGFSFDWDREVRTSDPEFYKWTQWIFIKLFHSYYKHDTNKAEPIQTLIDLLTKNNYPIQVDGKEKLWNDCSEKEKSDHLMNYRLAFLSEAIVNWCPQLGTVLANEEVKDGVSERGGYPVERKSMPQWSLRITAYADRLLNDLESLDWTEAIKEQQRNWIGKSEGTSLKFSLIPDEHSSSRPSPPEKGVPAGYEHAKKEIWSHLKDHARENRKNQTEAETILWERVRNSKLGFKIRRQHTIEQFIADFVCLDKKLIIELDGEIHLSQKEYDEQRTLILEDAGFYVIRFTNDEVINKTDWVCDKIKTLLSSPSPVEKVESQSDRDEAELQIEVFTTRPDTIFGVTFLTLSPEHEFVSQITTAENKKSVDEYVTAAKNRSERERMADVKKITGVATGAFAIHPFSGKKIPIWIGDYVLAGYGTGAVMGVPAHDTRDFDFAKHFELEIKKVIEPPSPVEKVESQSDRDEAYDAKEGKLVNSEFLNGLDVKDAIKRAIEEIEKKNLGQGKTNYRLRDAIFGRQRYWGEPIPIYYKDGIPYTMNEKDLPLVLPEVDKFLPTETGEPPLARATNWKYDPEGTGGKYEYEKTTMPGWAGSSWYYLRYMDAHNSKECVSKEAVNYWKDVDLYIGGNEHATGHLLYVRFWTKFLFDIGVIPTIEPAKKLINQGMIQGRSNFVYRIAPLFDWGTDSILEKAKLPSVFISKSLRDKIAHNNLEQHFYNKIHDTCINSFKKLNPKIDEVRLDQLHPLTVYVDVNLVDNDILNTELFKKNTHDLNDPIFFNEEDGKYLCGWEIEKMSKSKYNVVNPDDMCEQFGADCFRMYEMFLGPLEQSKPWNTNGITGVYGFLKKYWKLFYSTQNSQQPTANSFFVSEETPTKQELKSLHKTIKKATEDIDRYSFNTSVSNFMICVNELTDLKCNKRAILEPLTILIAPYAPHIAEELWEKLGHAEGISYAQWPKFEEKFMTETAFKYPVSFNGKTRFFHELDLSLSKEDVEAAILALSETQKQLDGKAPKKVIVVHNKIVNIVL